jgi:hypothetical protein
VEHVECAGLLAGGLHPHHLKWVMALERVLEQNKAVEAQLHPGLQRSIARIRRRVDQRVLSWSTPDAPELDSRRV